ncbi:glutathionylspermidine synthase family protein [Bacillus massiliigorillae]|uniref:glutathionylspermidine synthase family protein n=1 Tax=Bacillus massiliigorillae TaxID=1243664 RepID=UPI0003A86355|nr:glutathionylspermidine synthase family protein [Bacillus massiliigorillae]
MRSHVAERQQLYGSIPQFWHDIYGTEYALLDIKIENRERIGTIRTATERIGRIFYKTSSLLRQLDDETLLQLGFPKQTLSYLRIKNIPFESVIARLDLVVSNQEIKLLEINSDTPTFIKETFHVNHHVCQYFSCDNVNAGYEENLADSIRHAVQWSLASIGAPRNGKVVFTSHSDHEEDFFTSAYLADLYGEHAECIPIHELKIVEEDVVENGQISIPRGVYTPNLEKIDVLYRQTYPIEHLINDEDPTTSDKVGEILLRLVENKDVAILNPPSAFLLQSKAIISLIWGLHEEQHEFYSADEHEWIETYFLPTYLDEDVFKELDVKYVKKPSFGREGDTVQIFNEKGLLQVEDQHQTYAMELPIYQKYIELPRYDIVTEEGKKTAHIMYGSFLLNGKSAAIGIRAGGPITDNTSYFLPIGYHKREENE